jgi:hypothetical protein
MSLIFKIRNKTKVANKERPTFELFTFCEIFIFPWIKNRPINCTDRWPIFRPNNSKQTPQKMSVAEKEICGREIASFG